MAKVCSRHPFEHADNVCSKCGMAFCFDCLVYPKGPRKPPLCVNCALSAAGVRANAKNAAALSKRQMKKQAKELRRQKESEPVVATSTYEVADELEDSYDMPRYGSGALDDEPAAFDPRYHQPIYDDVLAYPDAHLGPPPSTPHLSPAASYPDAHYVPAPGGSGEHHDRGHVERFDHDPRFGGSPELDLEPEPPAARPPRLSRYEPPRREPRVDAEPRLQPASHPQPDGQTQPERRSRLRGEGAEPPVAPSGGRTPAVMPLAAHPPVRKGGLPSVRPPLGSPESRSGAPKREPRVYGIPKPGPGDGEAGQPEANDMLSWLDNLVTKKDD